MPRPGMALARLDRRAHALVGERRRQPDVDDRQVRLVAGEDPQQARARPRPARRRRSPCLAQQRDDALAQQRLVLGDDYSHGSSARARSSLPPACSDDQDAVERLDAVAQARTARRRAGPRRRGRRRRSRRPGGRPPRTARPRAGAPRRVLGGVGQRLGDDEVGGGLDAPATGRRSSSRARP